MRNIKLSKTLLKVGLVAIPTVLATTCSLSSCTKKEEKEVESVKIVTEIKDITVDLGQQTKTEPILSKCYDQNDEEITNKQAELQLLGKDGNPVPAWIYLNNKNQICLFKEIEGGSWTFNVQAKYENIVSEPIPFTVNIVDPKLSPDSIEIISPNEFNVIAPSTEYFNLNLVAYKDEKVSVVCNKNCDWKITNVEPLNPSAKIPSFYLEDLGTSSCLYCTTDHASASTGEFNVTIQAKSKVNQDLACQKVIKVCISNGQSFTDPDTGYGYRRMTTDSDWVLFRIPEDTTEIKNVRSEIQDIPVYKVFDYLCYISEGEEGRIKSIDLPSSITHIGPCAFANQKNLESACIPGVKIIAAYGFSNCKKMTFSKAKPEPQLEEAGSYCFENCTNLKMSLHQPIVQVHLGAFMNSGIDSIYFSWELFKIEDKSFENCANLTSITIDDLTPPLLNGDPFKNINSGFKIYVPQSDINDYLTATGWKNYSSKIVGF